MAWVAFLIVAGAGVIAWQQIQIAQLRAQVARQADANGHPNDREVRLSPTSPVSTVAAKVNGLRRYVDNRAEVRANERRIILDQYRDVLTEMNLPTATALRLQDLLTERIESVLDAEQAASEQGYTWGSDETARAVMFAIAGTNQEIVRLVGLEAERRLDGLLPSASPEVVIVPEPATSPAFVTVVVQAPPAPSYADALTPADIPAAYPGYYPYATYPLPGVVLGRGVVSPAGLRSGPVRPYRPSMSLRTTAARGERVASLRR